MIRKWGREVATVVLSGYYGFGNTGDEAVLAGIVQSFKELCPQADLVALSADPADTQTRHGIRAVRRMNPGEVKAALKSADLVASGGGSLLQNVTSSKSLAYYLAIIWMAKRYKKKVMIYAQGIGPILGSSSRAISRAILNKVDLITVRDEASKAYLSYLGVNRPQIVVTGDPSFAMPPSPEEEAGEILKTAGVVDDRPLIGVSVRAWKGQSTWLPLIAQGIENAANAMGASIVFLPMQRDQDLGISVEMASRMTAPASVIAAQLDCRQMMAITAKMSMVVGMRLHSLIFASASAVPFVGLSYDPKVEAFVRRSMHEDPLRIDDLSASVLTERIVNVWGRKDSISGELSDRSVQFRESALKNAEMACDLISGQPEQ